MIYWKKELRKSESLLLLLADKSLSSKSLSLVLSAFSSQTKLLVCVFSTKVSWVFPETNEKTTFFSLKQMTVSLNHQMKKESKISFSCRPASSSQPSKRKNCPPFSRLFLCLISLRLKLDRYNKLDSCSKGDLGTRIFLSSQKARAHTNPHNSRTHAHNTRSRKNNREDVFRVLAFVRSLFEV